MQKQIIDYINQYLLPCFLDTAKGFSTQTTLLYFIEKWNFILDKKECVGPILMDLSKTFNAISYELLVAKLDTYGFSKETLKLILCI